MQPVKITIYGNFFDCQIYRGFLYLWDFNGTLGVYDWRSLVNSRIGNEKDRMAITYCFLDGNYLYKSSLVELFKDDEFKNLLMKKFARIQKLKLEYTKKELSKFSLGEQTVPTNILPTDTEIYSNNLYSITDEGLFRCSIHEQMKNKYPVYLPPEKLWDCNLLSIKANKYPQIALSGGSEGLFELNMTSKIPTNMKMEMVEEFEDPIYKISNRHSFFANYSHMSIYNTSSVGNSFLADFKWEKEPDNQYFRNFNKIISEEDLFGKELPKNYLSWGIGDKIYIANQEGEFDIIKYSPNAKDKMFSKLERISLAAWKGNVINGGTSYFGNIVECENALVIVMSDNNCMTIPGPITRWRVYPRSLNYENHLHVILDDKIEIYSFIQDFFVEQNEKAIGIKYSEEKHNKWRYGKYLRA